jgi:hypothetical protein
MESIDLSTENPLDGSFLNISLEETVHTTKYDSYQCDICQKKFKFQQNLDIVIIYFVCFYVLVHVLTLVEGFAAKRL